MLNHEDMKRRAARRRLLSKLTIGGIIVAVLVVVVVGIAIARSTEKTVTFTVKDKTTKISCDRGDDGGGCKDEYIIYTDKGTFKDTDALFFFKFNSSDVYGQLDRGKRYACKVYGWRNHWTSSYPNIISCEDAA